MEATTSIMPFARRPMSRRGYRRYRRPSSMGYRRMTKVATRAAKRVIAIQAEKHYLDVFNGGTVTYNGTAVDICAVGQGDTDLLRTGDRIRISSIKGTFHVYNTVTNLAADLGTVVRLIIIQWLSSDTSDPVTIGSDIIESTYVGGIDAPFGHYAKDFAGYKFVPLWDRIVRLDAAKNSQVLTFKITPRHFKKKAKPFIQFTSGGTNGIGKIYFCMYSNNLTTGEPTVRYSARMRFTD